MQYFQDVIRKHHLSLVNGSTSNAMILNYFNNSDPNSPIYNTLISQNPLPALSYTGWIQAVEKNYIRLQNLYMTNYTMTVINKNNSNPIIPSFLNSSTSVTRATTFAPTASTQDAYGSNWVNIAAINPSTTLIKGIPKQ